MIKHDHMYLDAYVGLQDLISSEVSMMVQIAIDSVTKENSDNMVNMLDHAIDVGDMTDVKCFFAAALVNYALKNNK